MLSSLLKIEALLMCDMCKSTLRETTTLSECGHRFCLQCVKPHIEENNSCPTCQLPTQVEDLQVDRMHDNLVKYVAKLKQANLLHSLTPLEESLRNRQDSQTKDDFIAPLKRPINSTSTQDSVENLEDEYTSMPDRKKYKPNEDTEDEEDYMALLDDLLEINKRPSRSTKAKEVKYTVDPLEGYDDEMNEVVQSPLQRVGSPRTPEETATSGQTWKCNCSYENASFMQVCGICKKPKNVDQVTPLPIKNSKGKAIAADTLLAVDSSSSIRSTRRTQDQSLADATVQVPLSSSTKRLRRVSFTPSSPPTTTTVASATTTKKKNKNVHIIYTTVTLTDEKTIEKSVAKVKESNIHFLVVQDVKDIEDVTHIITSIDKKDQCHRTLKYLFGILLGKWVVSPKWLVDSLKAKKWLSEDAYEVKGDAKSGLTHSPTKGRERVDNKQPPLLSNLKFHFAGDYSGVYNKKDLTSLVNAGGATVLNNRPSLPSDSAVRSTLDLRKPIIIYSQGTKKRREAWLDDYQVRDPSWLIECIGNLKVE